MLVSLANQWLTNDGTGTTLERAWTTTQDLKLDGKQLIQEQGYIRAAVQDVFDRGNAVHTLTFRVTRNFHLLMPAKANPIAQASLFAVSHFYALTRSGALVITCGGWGEATLAAQAPAAVLESASCTTKGVQVVTTYTIRFGLINWVNPDTDAPVQDPGGANFTDPTGVVVTDPST